MTRKYNEAMGWMAVIVVQHSGVVSNNMGVAADPKRTSEAEWRKLSACIGQFGSTADLNSVRAQFTKYCGKGGIDECWTSGGVQRLEQLALEKGCGNCTEKTAIAVMWLEAVGVRRLDFMELNTHNNIDHTFAVIGRVRASADSDPSTWGADAVVCDPWHDYGKVYPAADIETRMFRGYSGYSGPIRPHSIFRIG